MTLAEAIEALREKNAIIWQLTTENQRLHAEIEAHKSRPTALVHRAAYDQACEAYAQACETIVTLRAELEALRVKLGAK